MEVVCERKPLILLCITFGDVPAGTTIKYSQRSVAARRRATSGSDAVASRLDVAVNTAITLPFETDSLSANTCSIASLTAELAAIACASAREATATVMVVFKAAGRGAGVVSGIARVGTGGVSAGVVSGIAGVGTGGVGAGVVSGIAGVGTGGVGAGVGAGVGHGTTPPFEEQSLSQQ
jgi:hypothetical protein